MSGYPFGMTSSKPDYVDKKKPTIRIYISLVGIPSTTFDTPFRVIARYRMRLYMNYNSIQNGTFTLEARYFLVCIGKYTTIFVESKIISKKFYQFR